MITDNPSEVDYLLIGHLTADIVEDGRQLGGTVSYAAKTARAFGLRVGMLTSASAGEKLMEAFDDDIQIVSLPAENTTTFENIYEEDVRHQFVRATARSLTFDDVPAVWHNTNLVHVAPLVKEVSPSIVANFPKSIKLLTMQGMLRQWGEDGLVKFKRWFDPEALKQFNFVVFSEEDIQHAPDLESSIAELVPCLIVTRAEKGGTIYRAGTKTQYSAPQVDVTHLTGAGDIFACALLSSWHYLRDVDKAVAVSAKLASYSVTRVGLDSVPSADDVRVQLAQNGFSLD